MTGARGFTIVELIVATAVMVTMTAAVMTLLHDGLVRTPDAANGMAMARMMSGPIKLSAFA